jgi:hypothetical protein
MGTKMKDKMMSLLKGNNMQLISLYNKKMTPIVAVILKHNQNVVMNGNR